MDARAAKEEVYDRCMSVSSEEFEQLTKIVFEETERPKQIQLTPFRSDGGIDIKGAYGKEFVTTTFGVEVKQWNDTVNSPLMRSLLGAMDQHELQYGCFVTTSEYSSGAVEAVSNKPVTLIDRDRLQEIMLEHELGVTADGDDSYAIDYDFWDIFERTKNDELVSTDEVPQADTVSTLQHALMAIDQGDTYTPQIVQYLEKKTGDEWTRRQGDYYPIAGYALGLVHKDRKGELGGREMRQWGLTRDGEEYVELLLSGEEEEANEYLNDKIRSMEVISRILPKIRDERVVPHSKIKDLVFQETELNETTANRRASTIGSWLSKLPEIDRKGHAGSLRYEYLEIDLGDF